MDLNINVNIDWKEANKLVDKILNGLQDMSQLMTGQNVKQVQKSNFNKSIETHTQTETKRADKPENKINTDNAVTYELEEVRKALGDLSKSQGKELAKTILKNFEATKLTDVPQDQYSALMKKIKEVI